LFSKAVAKSIPVKTIKDINSPPWIDGGVRHLIRKKYAALRKFRQSKTVEKKLKLRTATQNVKSLIKKKHREDLAKVEDSLSSNPKHFWSYHKAILHHRTSPSTIITYDGATAKTAPENANLFNQYFSSTFSHHSAANANEVTSSHYIKVSDCLNSLDTTEACGPDGIPSRLLKECRQQIAPSLCTIFNHSLTCGRFPSEWKSANVTPVFHTRKTPKNQPKIIDLFPCYQL
jgi:hypothetical protein